MARKRTPKPLAPRHLLEELLCRQQTLQVEHTNELLRRSSRKTGY